MIELIQLIRDYIDKRNREIIIGCIAQIVKHDIGTMRADVVPLLKYTAKGETVASNFAVIPNVPVLFTYAGGYFIRPQYQKGDLVWVTFATFPIANSLNGNYDDTGCSLFNRDSCAVICGIAKNNWDKPKNIDLDGLLIGHKEGVFIQIADDKITINADLKINGNISLTGKVEADMEVTAMKGLTPINLSTHTHPTGVGPSGSPNPGS